MALASVRRPLSATRTDGRTTGRGQSAELRLRGKEKETEEEGDALHAAGCRQCVCGGRRTHYRTRPVVGWCALALLHKISVSKHEKRKWLGSMGGERQTAQATHLLSLL
jgi:hypothetical protein